ncbi:diaminopimelate decarboxylase [Gloeomargarita lithophora Alchichica-D10]|uniref:Diaminopimelate decarboxylase n=1 Tax=Gloeomargarita lithophora Alchichica-D10 TaxID=1188229 RepID=A0A1J0AF31_9CYAN|nr:diaminopimelate decarboxylase [Gloeomargarita lithophora]APB34540.1 diaminopimelate decarboxylase [Gloeomargarita lithophora Alchichica-D10]
MLATELAPNQQILPLTAGTNGQGHLEIGGCDVVELVRQWGSPLYILDETTLRTACRHYREGLRQDYPGDAQVIYATKAWCCLGVLAVVVSEGLGLDVVSGGELTTAMRLGVAPELVYFHGNNKSPAELALALDYGCRVVVDNWYELQTLVPLAQAANCTAKIMLRFTPGIECHTHEYIRTGHLDSKFGFDPQQLAAVFTWLRERPQLECIGLHAHIGSQIFALEPHRDLTEVLVETYAQGLQAGLPLREVNVGGGLGIRYTEADQPPAIRDWVRVVSQGLTHHCQQRGLPLPKLICEPGRSLVGAACVTAYTMGGRKEIPGGRTYISVDGGMSDNPRPITYQAQYQAVVANRVAAPLAETVTVAGKHCESGDILLKDIALPVTQPGDILVVLATGAYNYSMASNYNRIPRPAAILVQGGAASLIIKRETWEDLLRQDCLPERLMAP